MKRLAKFMFAGASSMAFLHKTKWLLLASDTNNSNNNLHMDKDLDSDYEQIKLFSVTNQTELAREIAFYLKTRIGKLQILKKDDDTKPIVNIMEDINSKVIYLVCTFSPDHNSLKGSIDDLLLTIATMKRQSPRKVNVVLPYYKGKDLPFSEEYLLELLESAGVDKVFTVNMHDKSNKISSHIPFVEVDAHRLCASYLKSQNLKDLVIVVANESLSDKAKQLKEKLEQDGHKVEIGMVKKVGAKFNYVGKSIEGRDVLLVDNVVDSGKPLYNISNYLNSLGAHSIKMFAPHGILDGEIVDFLDYSPINELVITNTLPLETSHLSPKINQLSVGKMLADIIAQSTFHKNLQELYQEGRN